MMLLLKYEITEKLFLTSFNRYLYKYTDVITLGPNYNTTIPFIKDNFDKYIL